MVVSETKEVTPKEEAKKTKTKKTKKKAEETKETKPKEEVKETKPIKEAKEETKTKEAKPTTKPTPTRRPRIKTVDWKKFEKFEPKTKPKKKSWIKEAIERATKEPIEIRGLTRGQIIALINQIKLYNKKHMDQIIDIKYDVKQGTALLAPTKKYFSTQ
jgi:hypothetical protein